MRQKSNISQWLDAPFSCPRLYGIGAVAADHGNCTRCWYDSSTSLTHIRQFQKSNFGNFRPSLNGVQIEVSGMILEKNFTFPGKKIHVPWKKYLQPLEKKFRLLWPCGPLVLWSCGPLVLWSWSSGPVVLWSSGPVVLVLWSCGPLAKAWKEICTDQKSLEGVQKEVKKKKKRDN